MMVVDVPGDEDVAKFIEKLEGIYDNPIRDQRDGRAGVVTVEIFGMENNRK